MVNQITSGLREGMSKKSVLARAKELGLSKSTVKDIKIFFKNDYDKRISNGNELAILNSYFNGSKKVEMPKDNTEQIDEETKVSHYEKEKGAKTLYDTLVDNDNDGYADTRTVQIDTKRKDGTYDIISMGDMNLDGKPESIMQGSGGVYELIKKREEKEEALSGTIGGIEIGVQATSVNNDKSYQAAGLKLEGVHLGKDVDMSVGGSFGTGISQLYIKGGHNFELKTKQNGTAIGVRPYVSSVANIGFTNSKTKILNGKDDFTQFNGGAGALFNVRNLNPNNRVAFMAGAGLEVGYEKVDRGSVKTENGFVDLGEKGVIVQPVVEGRIYDRKTGLGGSVSAGLKGFTAAITYNLGHILK